MDKGRQPAGRRIAVFENEDADKWKGYTEKVCQTKYLWPPVSPISQLRGYLLACAVMEECSAATRR
jgi:hypothetical protein